MQKRKKPKVTDWLVERIFGRTGRERSGQPRSATLRRTLGRVLLGVFAFLLVTVFSYTRGNINTRVYAATSSTVSFQARLQQANGSIVPDGTYNIEFKLYDNSSSGGSSQGSCSGDAHCLWTESYTGANKVQVRNGYLSVYLGSITAFPSIAWDQNLYITMNIGGTGAASWDGEMNPRIQLTAVPYAFSAGQLSKYSGSFTSTLDFATQTAARSILLPDASGTICLQSASSCGFATGSGAAFLQGGNSFTAAANLGTNDAYDLNLRTNGTTRLSITSGGSTTITGGTSGDALTVTNSTSSGNIFVALDNATPVFTVADGGAVTVAQNLTIQGTGTNSIAGTTNFSGDVTVATGKSLALTGGNTASRPASPSEGMLYYDTTTKSLLVYANGKWQADRSTATKIVAMGTASGCTGSSPVASSSADAADYVVTSCTSAQTTINSAISALPAGGGTVYLMEGTYVIDGSITLANNVTLAGSGPGTIIKLKDGINANIDAIYASTKTYVTVTNLKLDGNKANNSSGTQIGITFTSGSNNKADKVRIENFRYGGINLDSSSSTATASILANMDTYGVFSSQNTNIISNNSISSSNLGIWGSGLIANNYVQGGSSDGINAGSSSVITGNRVISAGGNGIVLNSSTNSTVTGNYVEASTSNGIYLTGSTGSIVSGNKVKDVAGGINDGIRLSSSDNNTIVANDITDTAGTGYAIKITSGTNNYLASNRYSGTGASSISDAGTTTTYGSQLDSSGNLINSTSGSLVSKLQSGSSADLFQAQDSSGNALFKVSSSGVLTLGRASNNTGKIVFNNAGNTGNITLQSVATAGNYTLNLPAEDGTLCSTGSVCSGYAPASGSANYIQNQNSSAQSSANFWISGSGRVDTALQAPLLQTIDQSSASTNSAALVIRSGNATGSTSNSGNLTIDAGSATGTAGTITIAGTNASGLTLGRSGLAASLPGGLTTSGGNANFGTGTITSGAVNGQTISSSASFTGTVAIQGASSLTLGTTGSATGSVAFKGSTAASGTITIQGPSNPGTYALTLPSALSGNAGDCLKDTNGSGSLGFASCITSSYVTLQNSYANSGTTDPQITLNQTNGGIKIRDGSPAVSGNLLQIQNNAGTATYFGISASALTLQDSGGHDALVFDSTTSHLKVYEDTNSPSRYVDIYYDSANSQAVLAASSGVTRIGNGTGNVTILLTGQNDIFSYTKTYTPTASYTNSDFTITRNLTAGANTAGGSVLKVEDLSTGSVVQPAVVLINQNNSAPTANALLIEAQTAGVDKFKVSTGGTVTIASGQSYTGLGAVTVSSAASTALTLTGNAASTWSTSSGALTLTSAAAATWSTTTGNLTIQAGGANTVILKPGSDSATALQVQTSGGSGILTVDTTNASNIGLIGIGAAASSTAKLYVTAGTVVSQRINQTGSSNILELQSSGTNVLSVSSTGATTIQNTQPAATSGAGAAAPTALTVTGAKGGNTNGGTAAAGTGSAIVLTGGTGGDAVSGSTNGAGGTGGALTFTAGTGGAGIGSGNGGTGGNIVLNTGTGGAGGGSGGSTGAGGSVIVKAGTNATNSFQVQDASSTLILTADTTNKTIGIGSSGASSTAKLYVESNSSSLVGIRANATSSANILELQSSGTTKISVASTGDMAIANTSSTAFRIQTNAGAATILTADTSNKLLKLGTGTPTLASASMGGLYVTDSAEIAGRLLVGTTTNGVDTNSGQLRYTGSFRNTKTITLTPEYSGAVMTGDGTNNIGTMTSDFCSGTSRLNLNVSGSNCGASDEQNYYAWTAQATNDYDIFVRYQLPSDFSALTAASDISMYGWRTASTDRVELVLYDASGTKCNTTDSGADVGRIVSATNLTWTSTALTSVGSCSFSAGDTILFRIHMVVGTNNDYARAGGITFKYLSNF